jgi:hypothetical protein
MMMIIMMIMIMMMMMIIIIIIINPPIAKGHVVRKRHIRTGISGGVKTYAYAGQPIHLILSCG